MRVNKSKKGRWKSRSEECHCLEVAAGSVLCLARAVPCDVCGERFTSPAFSSLGSSLSTTIITLEVTHSHPLTSHLTFYTSPPNLYTPLFNSRNMAVGPCSVEIGDATPPQGETRVRRASVSPDKLIERPTGLVNGKAIETMSDILSYSTASE